MPDKPPYSLLLDWMTESVALAPTAEPVAAGVLWRNNGVVQYSPGIPPAFTDQPDDTTATEGGTATFSVTATNATSYQWQKQESGAGAWSNISGATSASYTTGTLTAATDSTDKYRCVATGAGGTTTSNSATLTVIVAPVNTVAPALSGTAEDGQTLTCSTGTWTGTATITYAYQWQRNGSNISGSTASTRTLTSDDVGTSVRCVVTGTNAAGSASANSNAVTVSAASVLPSGALGAWYADDYESSPRRVIPNAASGTAVSANLWAAPRRRFADTIYWSMQGTVTTRTDSSATAPDGSNDASVITCSGNWVLRQAAGGNIPAGTYTMAINVRRNTGTNQVFSFTNDNTGTRGTPQTATASWQRFTHTFTLASPRATGQIAICSTDGTTGTDIQICDFELYAGSSDLGPSVAAGHMYLGANNYSTEPVVASNEIGLDNQGYGQIQLPAVSSITDGMTFVALIRKTQTASAYHATLCKMGTLWQQFTMTTELSLAPRPFIGTEAALNFAGLNNLATLGYHAIIFRYNGSTREMWIDDCKLHSLAGAVSTFSIQDFHVGIVNATSLFAGEKLYGMALWGSALTDAQVRTAKSVLFSRATAAGLTVANIDRVYCAEGDSISGANALCWPYIYGPNSSPRVFGRVFAVSGSSIATMQTRAALVDAVLPPLADRGSRKFILSVSIGANDLTSLGASTWLTNLGTYLDARVAAGWTVALCTPTPTTASGFNTQRALVLSTMRGWVGTKCAAIIDFAADATMGPDAAASNATLYSDGTHPTTLGQQNLEAIARTVLNGI